MNARKWGLILGWVLIDAAAIFLALYHIIDAMPEQRAVSMPGHPPIMVRMPSTMAGAQLAMGIPGTFAGPAIMVDSATTIPGMKTLSVGASAQDFTLIRVGEGPPVRLADLRAKKPVVLILSSFTCNVFCGQLEKLEQLYCRNRERAEFLLVVVREAEHVIPGLEFLLKGKNLTLEERRQLVARALQIKKITIPTVLDGKDRAVEKAYAGWPLRLVVISTEGKLALDAPFRPTIGLNLERVERWLNDRGR